MKTLSVDFSVEQFVDSCSGDELTALVYLALSNFYSRFGVPAEAPQATEGVVEAGQAPPSAEVGAAPAARRRGKLTQAQVDAILAERCGQESVKELAVRTGRSYSSVYARLQKLKLRGDAPPRKRGVLDGENVNL